jgi:hypothetical protein
MLGIFEDKKGGEEGKGRKRREKKGKRKEKETTVYIELTVNKLDISHMQCSMPRTF